VTITITVSIDMSDIIEQTQSALTTQTDIDPYVAYGLKAGTAGGQYLSFKNGEFLYGQNASVLPLGTRLAANMAGLRVGWRKWRGGALEDDLTVPLAERRPVEARNALGDTDRSLWDRGTDGKERDPWQFTNILELADADGQTFIYSTGSKGGISAIAALSAEYGKQYRQKPGLTPIIILGNDYYIHPEYGKTYVPRFELVDWAAPEAAADDNDFPGLGEPGASPEPKPAPVKAPASTAPATPPAGKRVPRF
jgi:hypothetical protein